MYPVQKFALEHIYASPAQDYQYTFQLIRVTKAGFPVKRISTVYNVVKNLPNTESFFHTYVIGSVSPRIVNLLKQNKHWYRDTWVNAQDDMNARNLIIQVYSEDGVLYPRKHIYYSFIDESSLLVAIEQTDSLKRHFDIEANKYFRIYSNQYYNTLEFNSLPNKKGIQCELYVVRNNTEKVVVQNKIAELMSNGGDVILTVNGYYTDNMNLNIPDNVFVEMLYDQSITGKEYYKIGDLRTFDSTLDNKLKYLLFRDAVTDQMQYEDDNEIYISTSAGLVRKGLYYYEHKHYAVRNVTDKDYSLYTSFVNNQASRLSSIAGGSLQDKSIVLYTRKGSTPKPLVYSSLKLQELYKLPQNKELDVLINNNYTISDLRAETLENSDYFKLASTPLLKNVTKELATSALGYNGMKYYFGYTPNKVNQGVSDITVPLLYQKSSYAYEYDNTGKLVHLQQSVGPSYSAINPNTKWVEFIQGNTPAYFKQLYNDSEAIPLKNSEYRIITAYYSGETRISDWEDVTDNAELYTIENNTLTFKQSQSKRVRVVYFDEPLVYDLELAMIDGVLYFPLSMREDRGSGVQNYPLDLPYRSIEVFMNGYRLTNGVGFFIQFPYISICDKTHIDYTKQTQSIHIRCHGFTLNKNDINSDEITGFVHNGVLTRNRYYDIRDDRVFSVFIKGKLYDRSLVKFAEEDNTVRASHELNGLPYTLTEQFISTKEACGLSTVPLYHANKEKNKRISDLYNLIYKEPTAPDLNVINDHYYLFSPTVSKIIEDMIGKNIPSSLYMTPYNDSTIIELLNNQYKIIYALDPIRYDLPYSIIEIHPHIGNAPVTVTLHQFRFLTNLVRIITKGKPDRINLSGYVTISTDTVVDAQNTGPTRPGGIAVL